MKCRTSGAEGRSIPGIEILYNPSDALHRTPLRSITLTPSKLTRTPSHYIQSIAFHHMHSHRNASPLHRAHSIARTPRTQWQVPRGDLCLSVSCQMPCQNVLCHCGIHIRSLVSVIEHLYNNDPIICREAMDVIIPVLDLRVAVQRLHARHGAHPQKSIRGDESTPFHSAPLPTAADWRGGT